MGAQKVHLAAYPAIGNAARQALAVAVAIVAA